MFLNKTILCFGSNLEAALVLPKWLFFKWRPWSDRITLPTWCSAQIMIHKMDFGCFNQSIDPCFPTPIHPFAHLGLYYFKITPNMFKIWISGCLSKSELFGNCTLSHLNTGLAQYSDPTEFSNTWTIICNKCYIILTAAAPVNLGPLGGCVMIWKRISPIYIPAKPDTQSAPTGWLNPAH